MKPYRETLATAVSVICLALPGYAQPATTTDTTTTATDATSNGALQSRYHMGYAERASRIIGKEVKNSQDQRLGKVDDLAIDLHTGKIEAVVLATGGFLDVDEKKVLVPASKFSFDNADKTLRLNVDQQQLKDAPAFDMSHWKKGTDQSAFNDVNQRFGVQNEMAQDQAAGDQTAGNQWIQRASKVIGSRVHGDQNQSLGKVENLIVDLPSSRIVEVIVSTGGFLGMDNEMSEVPPQSFEIQPDNHHLMLNVTKESLSSAPHFKSGEWPDVNNQSHVETVYQSYNTTPYFDRNQPDNSAQNVRDSAGASLTPPDQGNNRSDLDITRQIRKDIVANDNLSVDAKNVKIITVNGRVTLRGPVNTDEEKQTIARIAAQVVPQGNVDDQLQSKQTPTPASSNQ